jgi:hypothetical protein
MKVISEAREERDDVFSFWEDVPTIKNNEIVQIETKIEETTEIDLKKRITDLEKRILDLTDKIALENSKIELIQLIKNE